MIFILTSSFAHQKKYYHHATRYVIYCLINLYMVDQITSCDHGHSSSAIKGDEIFFRIIENKIVFPKRQIKKTSIYSFCYVVLPIFDRIMIISIACLHIPKLGNLAVLCMPYYYIRVLLSGLLERQDFTRRRDRKFKKEICHKTKKICDFKQITPFL